MYKFFENREEYAICIIVLGGWTPQARHMHQMPANRTSTCSNYTERNKFINKTAVKLFLTWSNGLDLGGVAAIHRANNKRTFRNG